MESKKLINELNKESLDKVAGGEKITYDEAWNTLPHSDSTECPHCGCKANKFMGTSMEATRAFDLMRCGKCCQRFVYVKYVLA